MNQLTTLKFNGTKVQVIDHAGRKWLTAEEAGHCLGYNEANSAAGVNNLFGRHKDEFTEVDSTFIKLMTVDGKNRDVRVFSDTGCIKLGFFANTAKAKDFRNWASKVLAGRTEAQTPSLSHPEFTQVLDVVARLQTSVAQLVAAQKPVDTRVPHPNAIKALLKQYDNSVTGIAQELGVDPATVSRVLHGRGTSQRVATAIAEAAGVPADFIWPGQYA